MTPADGQFREDDASARELDAADPLREYRSLFHVPRAADVAHAGNAAPRTNHDAPQAVAPRGGGDAECIYLVGNSLGLMPRATRGALEQELDDWARLGVEGHFKAAHPWYPAHEEVRDALASVVGALPREVVAMNSLTTNLHLLMVSFYRPTRERYKIVIEDQAFPSDSYAVQSQADFHASRAGFDAAGAVLRLRPRAGEATLRTDDILAAIDRERASIALVLLGGVNYLSGQAFDIPAITRFARERGVVVGWDLAHAAGNLRLRLHDDAPDFAAWCSYKYLNSGPGAVAGAFVHERHLPPGTPALRAGSSPRPPAPGTPALRAGPLPRFAGWWGNDPATRFRMTPEFVPVASADAWQLSNPPVLALAPLRVSLAIFAQAGMDALRAKSERLTAYLEFLLDAHARRHPGAAVRVLTPRDPAQRGCQLSLRLPGDARAAFRRLQARGVVCDFREPDVIRAAPVPLYTTFADVRAFAAILGEVLTPGANGAGA
ncbi:MAG: kynureninase [Planctomycetota bacterium]|nr:kynureninase [Planctomycetota bacterium]